MLRAALSIIAAATLSACGGLQWPPPPQPQSANPPRAAAAVPVTSGQSRTVAVQSGETLFDLAKRTGVTARAIIETNNLQPPYRIAKGQTLILPASKTHTVVRGDTLYGISRYYGLDAFELARLNNLAPPYNIRVNQSLVLPGGDPRPSVGVETVDRSGATGPSAPSPRGPALEKVHVVEEPRSASSGTERAAPVELPPPAAPKEIAAPAIAPSAQPNVPVAPAPAVSPVEPTVPVERPIERSAERPAEATTVPAPEKTQLASLPTSALRGKGGSGRFVWPVQGKLASEYGPKGDGLHNDGINIVAAKGTPVHAAASGIVAYAGNEIRGFGNLLLIQHSDGWMTAYAHNDKLLVKRGDRVEQGQQIGAVGSTGNVASPQLHFEIRRGKRAVDPLDQLGTLRAS